MHQTCKPDNPDVAAIKGFEHHIEIRYLRKEGRVWYADTIGHAYLDELTVPEQYTEGARSLLRLMLMKEVLKPGKPVSGIMCKGCGFDFEKIYGELGRDFIHVHHINPLKIMGESYKIDPVRNLVPLCPNCHAMVHRAIESRLLSVEALRSIIDGASKRAGATG